MNKKKLIIISVLLVLFIFVCFIFIKKDDVLININVANHSEKSFNQVTSKVKRRFNKELKGCKLISIDYDDKNVLSTEEYWKEENSAEEAIALTFTFKVIKSSEVFLKGESYTYRAEYIKVDGEWEAVFWGQG